ncbi:MAG: Ig domain-containing protein [Bacteroides sp.]|nr:Ig domain-containing protein [Bacteroides sp.]
MAPNCSKHIIPTKLTVASILLLSVPFLSGCGGSSDVVPDEPEKPVEMPKESFVTLDLRISVNDGGMPITRAFDPNDDGTFDNPKNDNDYEKVHTLRVVIVRADSTIEHNRMVTVRDNYGDVIESGDIVNDNLQFKVSAGEKKKIYLFANESTVNRNKTADEQFDFTANLKKGSTFPIKQIEDILITRDSDKAFIDNGSTVPLDEKSYVPMSEWFEVEVPAASGKVAEEFHTVEDLFLTRSLVKFSFSVALTGENLYDTQMTLRGIRISTLANSGYYLPKNTIYDPAKYTASTLPYYGRLITQFDVPMDAANPVADDYSNCTFLFDQPLPLTVEGVDRSPLIYLPESKLIGDNNHYNVTLLFSDPNQDDIYESKPLDIQAIPRNTHVKINILLSTHSMQATVTLFPYTAVDLKPTFGFGVPVTEIHITEEAQSVAVGQTIPLAGYVLPADANNKNIIWSSKKTNIATVDKDGFVTGVSEGTTEITATSADNPELKTTCTITVTPKIEVTVSILPENPTVVVGDTLSLTALVSPTNVKQDVTWASSDENVAKVDKDGFVIGVGAGTTKITATSVYDETKSQSCDITVTSKKLVTSITMSPEDEQTIVEGRQVSFTASVTPSSATNQDLKWTSSDPSVATVSSYGLVTAISAGETGKAEATIKAEATDGSGKFATCKVTVTPKTPVDDVSLAANDFLVNGEFKLAAPLEETLKVTVTPSNATYPNVIWTSSNPYVATVNNSGKVTATNKGKTTITVTSVDDPSKYASCEVEVTWIPVKKIILMKSGEEKTSWETTPGTELDLRAYIDPSNASNKNVTWKSSDENVAYVEFLYYQGSHSNTDYLRTAVVYIHAVGSGTATITCTSDDEPSEGEPKISTTFTVTVK